MAYNKKSATALLVIAIVATIANTLLTAQPNILDTDPSTYIIVPLIMLPVLAVLIYREKASPNVTGKDLAKGAIAFLAFIFLYIYLRAAFSFAFLGYHADMLIIPLALFSYILFTFGSGNVGKFKVLIMYSILASPLLLMPVINQNLNFAVANTVIIYNIARLFVAHLQYLPPITISANNYNVSIGEACAGVGALIGLALFLMPLAYFYEGKRSSKLLWLASGIALFLFLNLSRMLFIAMDWLTQGPNAAVLAVHVFIGILLFYASIIAMVLLAGRYGLTLPRFSNSKGSSTGRYYRHGAALSIACAAIMFFLTLNYQNSLAITPILLSHSSQLNFNNHYVQSSIGSFASLRNSTKIALVAKNGSSAAVILSNSTITSTDPVSVLFNTENFNSRPGFSQNEIVYGYYTFMSNESVTGTVYFTSVEGLHFYVYHTVLPFFYQNTSFSQVGTYVVMPSYAITPGTSCSNYYDGIYTAIYNIANPSSYNATFSKNLHAAYCLARRITG